MGRIEINNFIAVWIFPLFNLLIYQYLFYFIWLMFGFDMTIRVGRFFFSCASPEFLYFLRLKIARKQFHEMGRHIIALKWLCKKFLFSGTSFTLKKVYCFQRDCARYERRINEPREVIYHSLSFNEFKMKIIGDSKSLFWSLNSFRTNFKSNKKEEWNKKLWMTKDVFTLIHFDCLISKT